MATQCRVQAREGPLTTSLALWAAMHGVAALWAVTPSLPTDLAHAVGDLAHAVGDLAQDAVLAGLARSVRDRAQGFPSDP